MTGIDRDALAVQISESGNPRRRDYAAADRVIAHLAATGPPDTGLRERIEALCDQADRVDGWRVPIATVRAVLAAPDPGPDQGACTHCGKPVLSTTAGWVCRACADGGA